MAVQRYIDLPICDAIIDRISETNDENDIKAFASSLLSHYFPLLREYLQAYQWDHEPGVYIFRVKRGSFTEGSVADYVVAQARKAEDGRTQDLDVLQDALRKSSIKWERCWAVLMEGVMVRFYVYRQDLKEEERLVPFQAPRDSPGSVYHARDDAAKIHWVLCYMMENEIPPERQD